MKVSSHKSILVYIVLLLCGLLVLTSCSLTSPSQQVQQGSSAQQEDADHLEDLDSDKEENTEQPEEADEEIEENEELTEVDSDPILDERKSFAYVANQELWLNNLTFGMTSNEVHAYLGKPTYHGIDNDAGFYETISEYEKINAFVGYYNDRAVAISFTLTNFDLKQIDTDQLELYTDGTSAYYYHAESESILKVSHYEDETYLSLLIADNNFHFSVEQGWFTPIELPKN